MNRKVLWIGAALVVPLVAFLALAFRHDPRIVESPLVGKPAPEFRLRSLAGEEVALAELAGRPVVLNFWATWCQPCIAEHPVLVEHSRRYAGRVRFVGVIYDDDPEAIRRFVERYESWGPNLVDPGSEAAIRYGVYGAPETFFIDARGIVRRKITGPMGPALLDAYLREILG
ncbi:MAG: TlpA family protein disulfide reductase [Thermoanaerobaculia bacterium]